jgi:hypothetical protein
LEFSFFFNGDGILELMDESLFEGDNGVDEVFIESSNNAGFLADSRLDGEAGSLSLSSSFLTGT